MKVLFTLIGLWWVGFCIGQMNEETFLLETITAFHEGMIKGDTMLLKKHTDKALSYGHSNGWVQTQWDVINDFKNGVISYQKFTEDSVTVNVNGDVANVRFVADVEATLRGNLGKFHLKVLEVWVKRGKVWKLFGRQAVKY